MRIGRGAYLLRRPFDNMVVAHDEFDPGQRLVVDGDSRRACTDNTAASPLLCELPQKTASEAKATRGVTVGQALPGRKKAQHVFFVRHSLTYGFPGHFWLSHVVSSAAEAATFCLNAID